MPIFKACLLDRSKKIIVKANNLEELKSIALIKLGATATNARVVLETDGAEVDDDDVLMELSSSILLYMILIDEEEWSVPLQLAGGLQTSTHNTTPTNVERIQASPTPTLSPAVDRAQVLSSTPRLQHQLPSIPWDRFPEEFISDCRQNKVPSPGDRREVVKIVGKYLAWDVQQTSRNVVESVARAIVAKYPQVGDRIGSQLLGKGHESLLGQLYNKVMFEKKIRNTRLQASGRASTSSAQQTEEVDDPDGPTENVCPNRPTQGKKRPMRDSYGCVAWQPDAYPDGQTATTQEEQRLWLLTKVDEITDHSTQLPSLDECVNSMNSTYVSQRIQINKKESVDHIIRCWPFLAQQKCFLQHFSTLVGVDTRKKWLTSLDKKGEPIVQFIRGCKGKRREEILSISIPMTEACKSFSSKLPIHEAVVPLLQAYFGEKGLFQMFEETATEVQLVDKITVPTPVLAIVGSSLHGQQTRCLVVVDHKVVLRPTTVIDGFLIILAVYYVFNIVYAESCSSTLEFLQRVFLGINPSTGDKRGGKRKKATCDPKVAKLVAELTAFTNMFSLDD